MTNAPDLSAEAVERPLDEVYDVQLDVQQDPAGALMAIHTLVGEVARLRAEIAAAERKGAEGWQPISTAPKDGTNILITGGGPDYHYDNHDSDPPIPEMVVAWWSNRDGGFWQFCSYDGGVYGVWQGPTNWVPLPLPLPPSTREGE